MILALKLLLVFYFALGASWAVCAIGIALRRLPDITDDWEDH